MIRECKKDPIATKGWKILVKWKYGTQYWIPIKDIKKSNTVETSEYANANNLLEEPAFKWWAKKLLKKEGRMISMVKSYYWITIHKLDIDLHQYFQEAYTIDEENGDTFWRDDIYKKLKKI